MPVYFHENNKSSISPVDVAGLDPGEQRQAVAVSDHRTQFSPITIFENLEI